MTNTTKTEEGKPQVHEIKCWPSFFGEVQTGNKTFELRKDDRNYQIGDVLHIRCYDPVTKTYDGRAALKKIGYMVIGGSGFGLSEGYVAMSLRDYQPTTTGSESASPSPALSHSSESDCGSAAGVGREKA